MPSSHRSCLLCPHSDASRIQRIHGIHGIHGIHRIHRRVPSHEPTFRGPCKQSAQTAGTSSVFSRRELGEGTSNPIKSVSTATQFVAVEGAHSAALRPLTIQALQSDPMFQVTALQSTGARFSQPHPRRRCRHAPATYGNVNKLLPAPLDQHVFTKGEYQRARHRNNRSADTSNTQAEVLAIADAGAQSNLWSLVDFLASGFSHGDLSPVQPYPIGRQTLSHYNWQDGIVLLDGLRQQLCPSHVPVKRLDAPPWDLI